MCSIHVHVALCHFQISSIKFLSIMLTGHQVLSGTDNYYSHTFRNSAVMILQKMLPLLFLHELNWIELNFCHSKWPCCCFFGCIVQRTLTNMKKSFYCWNVARNSSKTSLKCVNDTWRILLGSPIQSPSSCSKGGYHEPLDSWIVLVEFIRWIAVSIHWTTEPRWVKGWDPDKMWSSDPPVDKL